MHNIRYIRSNPEQFEKLMKRRGISINSSEILDIDNSIRSYQTKMQVLQEKRNKASKEIGQMIAQGSDLSDLKKNISDLKIINTACLFVENLDKELFFLSELYIGTINPGFPLDRLYTFCDYNHPTCDHYSPTPQPLLNHHSQFFTGPL